jgi:hypothetical protein
VGREIGETSHDAREKMTSSRLGRGKKDGTRPRLTVVTLAIIKLSLASKAVRCIK